MGMVLGGVGVDGVDGGGGSGLGTSVSQKTPFNKVSNLKTISTLKSKRAKQQNKT